MKTYKEIQTALKMPIEAKFISDRKQGGATIKYVSVTDLKDILDSRLGDNVWESSVKSCQQIGDSFVMIVSLTVHCSDGAYCHDGTGHESVNHRGFGDLATNAFAQGFRRACESHGLGRELWRLELSDEQKDLDRIGKIKQRIVEVKNAIRALGGEVEKEDLDSMTENELMALGKDYKEQLERLKKN